MRKIAKINFYNDNDNAKIRECEWREKTVFAVCGLFAWSAFWSSHPWWLLPLWLLIGGRTVLTYLAGSDEGETTTPEKLRDVTEEEKKKERQQEGDVGKQPARRRGPLSALFKHLGPVRVGFVLLFLSLLFEIEAQLFPDIWLCEEWIS